MCYNCSNEENVSREPPGAPPNTRAPSPQPQAAAAEARLPYADPVPTEHKELASPWIEVCYCTRIKACKGFFLFVTVMEDFPV